MAVKEISLRRRGERRQFRIRVPKDLIGRLGRREICLQLGNERLDLSRQIARALRTVFERFVNRVRMGFFDDRADLAKFLYELLNVARERVRQEMLEAGREGAEVLAFDIRNQLLASTSTSTARTETEIQQSADAIGYELPDERMAFARLVMLAARTWKRAFVENGINDGPGEPALTDLDLRDIEKSVGISTDPPKSAPAPPPNQSKTVATSIAEHLAEVEARNAARPRTILEKKTDLALFAAYIGADRDMRTIDRQEYRDYRNFIATLPPGTRRPKLGDNVRDWIGKDDTPRLAPASINKKLSNLSAFLKWCVEEGIVENNLAPKSIVQRESDRKKEIRTFTTDQLKLIFNAPIYTGCESHHFYKRPGSLVDRDSARFWLPLIALITGARLNEVAGLATTDVVEIKNHLCIWFKPNDYRGVKSVNGIRYVPVHTELLKIGFRQFWETRKKNGEQRLFPDVTSAETRQLSASFSQWFGRFLDSLGIHGKGQVFHSYRHVNVDVQNLASRDLILKNYLTGHSQNSTREIYGSKDPPVEELVAVVEAMTVPVDLSHLHLSPTDSQKKHRRDDHN